MRFTVMSFTWVKRLLPGWGWFLKSDLNEIGKKPGIRLPVDFTASAKRNYLLLFCFEI